MSTLVKTVIDFAFFNDFFQLSNDHSTRINQSIILRIRTPWLWRRWCVRIQHESYHFRILDGWWIPSTQTYQSMKKEGSLVKRCVHDDIKSEKFYTHLNRFLRRNKPKSMSSLVDFCIRKYCNGLVTVYYIISYIT